MVSISAPIAMAVAEDWAASFCLGCDEYAGGRIYCSEECLLHDRETGGDAKTPESCPLISAVTTSSNLDTIKAPHVFQCKPYHSRDSHKDPSARSSNYSPDRSIHDSTATYVDIAPYRIEIRPRVERSSSTCSGATSNGGDGCRRNFQPSSSPKSRARVVSWYSWEAPYTSLTIDAKDIVMDSELIHV